MSYKSIFEKQTLNTAKDFTSEAFTDLLKRAIAEEEAAQEKYIEYENQYVAENFNVKDVLAFTDKHSVEILRGDDWQYQCWIDKKCYTTALTPMYALLRGIEIYNNMNDE